MSIFKGSKQFIELYIEQMDVLRRASAFDDAFFADYLKKRYAALRLGLLVVTDDAALRFAAEHYQELFAGVPVVFSDVSNPESIEIPPEMPVTGVLEHRDFQATVDLARRLRPEATQIVVFGNLADTGAGPRTAQTFLNKLKLDIPVKIINDLTLEEIIEATSQISPKDILIPLALAHDRHGIRYTYEEVNKAMSSVASTPLFNFWSLGIKGGYVLGGKVNDPVMQGRVAARLGLRILSGEDTRSIPIVSKAPTEYLFNYDLMKRYGITESALPRGSAIVGKPVSLYEEYKAVVLITLSVVLALILVIVVLLTNIGWRKRAEEALRDSEERYRNLFETMTLGVVYQAPDGHIITANPAAESILGLSKDQMRGRSSMDPCWRSIHEDGSEFPGHQHPAMLSLRSGKPVHNVITGLWPF
jgi:PAS domain-containing protein